MDRPVGPGRQPEAPPGADAAAGGVTLYSEPDFRGTARRLGDTGLAAYSLAALALDRVASVKITPQGPPGPGARVFRARLYDRAPVDLPTGSQARRHRLDITHDLPDTGPWADMARYVTVASCRADQADWGFAWPLAAGEPARYTLIDHPA